MKKTLQSILISSFLLVCFGCAAKSSETAAADARVEAASARVDAADANARVQVADAHVRAADSRVAAATTAELLDGYKPRTARPVIPSGTLLKVSLIDALGSDTSSAGDRFMASLAESVVIDGTTVLPEGQRVRGRVVSVKDSGRVKGLASIHLELTGILQGDTMMAVTTNTLGATAGSSKTRDGEIIAGGAGIGAVIGAIAGGGKGAAIGAVTGGGAGTGVVLGTKGKQIHYGPETRLNFTLSKPVHM
jgi:hypothetical protein